MISSNIIEKIQSKSLLVIGDVMLDTYINGEINRISPEAPVPVFKKNDERCVPGGASNVAANLVAAGQRATLASFVGDDSEGMQLKSMLDSLGVDTSLLLTERRSTISKKRFIAGNHQQVLRVDIERTDPYPNEIVDKLIDRIESGIENYDLILFSDYNKGLLTEYFMQSIIKFAFSKGIKTVIDVKDPNFHKYSGAYLLKPNKKELHDLTGIPVQTDEQVFKASEYLREQTKSDYVLTTCGARGMLLKGADVSLTIDAVKREVFDVTGAGDTTIAYLAAGIVNNMNLEDALFLSSYAASIQVGKVGTSLVHLREVSDSLVADTRDSVHKLIEQTEAFRIRDTYHDKKIVFTNGVFDILHAGHVRYLQEARKLGDILVIGLNSDNSTKRIKGPERPINNQSDRAEVLGALKCVDYIVIFDEDTPYELIKSIQPDILVKGGDYKDKEVIGSDIVKARGGEVKLIDFVPGHSTTSIIKKIRA